MDDAIPKKYRQFADGHVCEAYVFGMFYAIVGNPKTIRRIQAEVKANESPARTLGGTYYNRTTLFEQPFGEAIIFHVEKPSLLDRLGCIKHISNLENPNVISVLNKEARFELLRQQRVSTHPSGLSSTS